jgi:hypothetical protein
LNYSILVVTVCAMIKSRFPSMLLLLAMLPVGLAAQNPLDEVAEALERDQMQRLAAQQRRPGVIIDRFRSDGCSGGMSQAWSWLADSLPGFADYAGKQPPWEACCVAHDRDYWYGKTQNGVAERAQSDARLRACVRATGEQRSAEISQVLGLPRQDIVEMINLTADLMYQAVRLGGGPCTGLAWRWGHGWPECSAPLEPGNQI